MDRFVNAQLDLSFAVKLFKNIDIVVTAARVLDLRPTEFDISFHAEDDCTLRLRRRGWWNAAPDEPLGGVEQHSIWLTTLFVFRDLSAERARRALVDATEIQGRSVRHRAVSIGASEYHWIVRSDFVEVPASGKYRRLPVRFDPAAAGHPFAGFCLADSGFELREQIFEARRAFKIQRYLAEAHA